MGAQIARSPVTGTRTAGARTEHPPVVGGALRGSKAREAAR